VLFILVVGLRELLQHKSNGWITHIAPSAAPQRYMAQIATSHIHSKRTFTCWYQLWYSYHRYRFT